MSEKRWGIEKVLKTIAVVVWASGLWAVIPMTLIYQAAV